LEQDRNRNLGSIAQPEQQMNNRTHYYVFGSRLIEFNASSLLPTGSSKEDSMKSLAYVFAAILTMAIVAPSVASAGDMHHHHHHHYHHHHMDH
jgi:hypothetical protein